MFQYDAFVTLDFQKILPACRQGYFLYFNINPTCWRGELRAQPEPRAQSAQESRTKPEIERGDEVWGGGSVSPPQKNLENSYLKPCILVYS